MERVFAASPADVFAFITQTANLLQWWGPEGTRIAAHNLDFSKPGDWRATMLSPQGHAHTVGGTVLRVDPPKLVELTLSFELPDGARGPQSTIRFALSPVDTGGTHFLLTQTGLKAEHIADMRDKGWASALDRLQILITNL